jgi:hypothetical protein
MAHDEAEGLTMATRYICNATDDEITLFPTSGDRCVLRRSKAGDAVEDSDQLDMGVAMRLLEFFGYERDSSGDT